MTAGGVVLPSGTVTFLFTDIEGSTRLWEEHHDDMAVAVERHDAIVRQEIERRDGYVFTTAGDSFAASFDRADDAVAAAVAAQSCLVGEPWSGVVRIQARMGLHTGEASERGGDYFGPTVNRAARLMSAAHGGQIVVSDTTASIVGRNSAVALQDLGEHVLKDMAEPVRVWQLGASNFPPLRTLDNHLHNLPSRLEAMIGREIELDELTNLVRTRGLVTVVGPGGMGKSRLATQVAAEIVDEYADGVWFVDLVPAEADIDSIATAIAGALGFDVRQGESWTETTLSALSVRSVLLVLDNCEHVLGPTARLVGALLDAAPGVKILATSRERLAVRGEQIYSLGHLEAGPDLFIATATNLDPTFDPTSSLPAIEQICERLDGLPLAIELAAGRIRTMQPEEIATRLDERFRLLRSRDQTRDPRQRSLAATLEWSFEQLDPDSQDLFIRLGVFSGSFGLAAAVGVADPALDDLDVADLLGELEAKSLVTTARSASITRYRLLDTMAAFAVDRLETLGTMAETRQRHAAMRARLARHLAAGLEDPAQDHGELFASTVNDQDDLNAAFDWALEHEPPLAQEIFAAVTPILILGTSLSISRPFAEAVAADESGATFAPLDRGFAAYILVNSGAENEADRLVQSLMSSSHMSSEARGVVLGIAAHNETVLRNNSKLAIELAEQGITAAGEMTDPFVFTFVRWVLPIQQFQAGNLDRAIELVIENEAHPQLLRGAYPGGVMLRYAAGVCWRPRDLVRSTSLLSETRDALIRIGDTRNAAFVEYHLALNKLAARDDQAAAEDLVAVLPAMVDRGQIIAYGLVFEDLALALTRSGAPAAAVTAFAVADAQLSASNEVGFEVYVQRRERLLPRLKKELGDGPFDAAWAEGHDLTVDEAVRHMQALVAG